MTTPVWPASLPQAFMADGFSEESPDNVLASQTSIGPAKLRRRSTSAIVPVSGSMVMSYEQLAAFKAFYADDLKGGSIAFTFPDPFGGSDLLVRNRSYTIAPFGIDWRVQLSLEVLP